MKTQSKLTLTQIIEAGHDVEQAPAVLALCQHLGCSPADVEYDDDYDHYGLNRFKAEGNEYAVGTDSEADDAALANIKDSVWAFRASFILDECCLPDELEEGIRAAQEKQCESANDWITSLIEKSCEGGMKAFAESAISADGRGHFMSSYDGEENEETVTDGDGNEVTLYIYRTN